MSDIPIKNTCCKYKKFYSLATSNIKGTVTAFSKSKNYVVFFIKIILKNEENQLKNRDILN